MHLPTPAWKLLGLILAVGSVSPWLWPNKERPSPGGRLPAVHRFMPRPAAIQGAAFDPETPCPASQLPSEGVCVPVTDHTDQAGRLETTGRVLPRDPERPANFYRYRWPLQFSEHTRFNVSLSWAKSAGLPQTGVTLDDSAPARARLLAFSGQIGAADVLYAGPALNGSVVTVHHVKDRSGDIYYALVIGNLTRRAAEVATGVSLQEGAVLGEAAAPGNKEPGRTSLWLACYRVRLGYSKLAWQAFPDNLRDTAALVPVDLRDVLPYL